uniref:Ig-like domain-containing protein n=2 Tax=Bos indicus x Bos taurus TaxID=30522 RepID=A0A4W2G1U6_BOBOX
HTGLISHMSLEPECTHLIHSILKRDNRTYSLCANLGGRRSAFLRDSIELLVSDLTQKPELHVPGTPAAGGSATLVCSFKGTCKETKALFVSWKGPNVNSSSPPSSSVVRHLNFSPAHLPGSSMVRLQVASPARLLYFSCSLEKTLQCSCSFRGSPMPSVRWLMGGDPVDLNSMHKNFQVTSNIAAPWANSTISLLGEPEIVRGLHCEGRNQHGIHTSSIFLIPPDKNSVSNALLKGLIQGVVYGSIATVLFLFFLVLLVMKMLKWWEESHIPKASEALIPEKPELLEEPKTPQESAAEPSPASVAGKSLGWAAALGGPRRVMVRKEDFQDPWSWKPHH